MKILPALFAASLLASPVAVFANDQAAPKTYVDQELRSLLGVQSLHGEYTFPKQDKYFVATTLRFENGKFIGTGNSSEGDAKLLPNRIIRVSLLWSDVNGKTTSSLSTDGNVCVCQDAFLKNIGGANGAASATLSTPDQYKGYHILAFAQSALSIDGKSDHSFTGDDTLLPVVKAKKYVVALAVKSYATPEDAKKDGVPAP